MTAGELIKILSQVPAETEVMVEVDIVYPSKAEDWIVVPTINDATVIEPSALFPHVAQPYVEIQVTG